MIVYLMFSPTRTREYSRSPFDFTLDFFVKFAKLEAVCATLEATRPIGQQIMEDLSKDCSGWGDEASLPYQLANNFMLWKEHMPKAWHEAVGVDTASLLGGSNQPPNRVFVVLDRQRQRIWGGEEVDCLAVRDVFVDPATAASSAARTFGSFVSEMPLLGVPTPA